VRGLSPGPVGAVAKSRKMRGMALWLSATILHIALTAFWVRAFGAGHRDRDDIVFDTAVVGLGSLQAALHAVAFTVGLTLGRGVAALAALHLAAAAAFVLRGRRASRTSPAPDGREASGSVDARALAAAGAVVFAALIVQWALAAAASLRVTGADAAHYHVPYAVNIALGANPFGLPATPHLYPMGTSVLAAWFILPFRDALLADLANLLPFLLASAAVLRIVRDTTGRPGSAWGPWIVLALFALPVFRHSLLVSADLFYAAAFLAVNAVLLGMVGRLRADGLDVVSLGFATGMLVSTKVTGVFSAAALAGVYTAAIVIRARLEKRRFEGPGVSPAVVAAAAAVAMASGGIWLIRNWWNFGSPLAPSGLSLFGFEVFPGEKYGDTRYYLSVLRDMRDVAGYSLSARTWYWAGVWLNHGFVLSGLLALAPFVSAGVARFRGRPLDEVQRARLAFTISSLVLIAAHLALLVGVPWSSLEWTDGFALRYALPCLALYGLAVYAAVLPALTRSPRTRTGAAWALALASVAWYGWHQNAPPGPPEETLARLTPMGLALGAGSVAAAFAVSRLRRPSIRWVVAVALAAAAAAAYVPHAARSDRQLVRSAETDLERLVVCSTCDGLAVGDRRRAYLALLASERARNLTCAGRRIFTTSRWDTPLDLQSPRFDNEVFDVRGLAFTTRLVERDRPGRGPCDYVIATRAALDTTNGVPLVRLLKEQGRVEIVAEAGQYVVFGTR